MPKKWFRVSFAKAAFERLLAARGLKVAELDVATGIDAMIEFYEQHGAQHTADGGEDALHIAWDADDQTADFVIARRMVRSDDPTVRELALRFEYRAAPWHTSGSALFTDTAVVRDLEAIRLASAGSLSAVSLELVEL
jgi:hypothetical protein